MIDEVRAHSVGVALISVGVMGAAVLAFVVKEVLDQILRECRWGN